jgi:hypothetical protein
MNLKIQLYFGRMIKKKFKAITFLMEEHFTI